MDFRSILLRFWVVRKIAWWGGRLERRRRRTMFGKKSLALAAVKWDLDEGFYCDVMGYWYKLTL